MIECVNCLFLSVDLTLRKRRLPAVTLILEDCFLKPFMDKTVDGRTAADVGIYFTCFHELDLVMHSTFEVAGDRTLCMSNLRLDVSSLY